MSHTADDRVYMERALRLAARGRGTTHPNPMVGAVLVREGRIVGEGWHREPGTPHAEVHAIRDASSNARGSSLYLNLEPCSHQGRTPPCTEAIIEAGVSKVAASCRDPNPSVGGRGFEILRKAGVVVTVGLLEDRARELNRAFLRHTETGAPYVTLKLASTLDGKIATSAGESRWITGEPARRAVHRLRADADGVLVGVETVLADDPELTVRHVRAGTQPRRIILDRNLRTPIEAGVVEQAEDGRTVIVVGRSVDEDRTSPFKSRGVRFWRLQDREGFFPWADLARALTDEGVIHLLVEGGGETAAFFLRSDAVARVELFFAPTILGREGIPSVGALDIQNLSEAPKLGFVRNRRIGQDIQLTLDVVSGTGGQRSENRGKT